MARGGKKFVQRIGCGCASLLGLFLVLLFLTEPGQALRDVWGTGAIQAAVGGKEMREYNATTESNLRAIHTAMMLYHDSEGQFPEAAGWMDAIENRIVTNDMEGTEAQKKLVAPSLQGQAGKFGYAMNDKASAKYKDDLDPKTPLIFDSSDTTRNAHGMPEKLSPKPARDGQNMAIAVDGTILKL